MWADLPFFIVNPHVSVRLANGNLIRVGAPQAFPGLTNVLLLDAEEIVALKQMMTELAPKKPKAMDPGSKREPVLWDRFFGRSTSYSGGWVLETHPVIARIDFFNDERTKAAAHITAGDRGSTVVLEKNGNTWTAKAVVNEWIS